MEIFKKNSKNTKIYFLGFVILIYLIIGIFNLELFKNSLSFFSELFIKIFPVFFLVFTFSFILNFFITQKQINHYIGKSSGYKRWIIAILAGIISVGPVFVWYPILKNLQTKGVGYGFIATFIYNRAIKLAFIPVFLIYFDWKYILTLFIVLIVFSLIQGLIFEKFINIKLPKETLNS